MQCPSWRQEVRRVRTHIRNKDQCITNMVYDIMQKDMHNKRKILYYVCKWAVYYNDLSTVDTLLEGMPKDHWYNMRYHAVYHNKPDIIEHISSMIDVCSCDTTT